jgi:hypothetical protein
LWDSSQTADAKTSLPLPTLSLSTMYVKAARTALLEKPQTGKTASKRVGSLEVNAQVEVVDKLDLGSDGWLKVVVVSGSSTGKTGWVKAASLSDKETGTKKR